VPGRAAFGTSTQPAEVRVRRPHQVLFLACAVGTGALLR